MTRDFQKADRHEQRTEVAPPNNLNTGLSGKAKTIPFPGPSLSLLDSLPVAVYVLQKGRLRYVNPSFSAMLAYENPNSLLGRSLWDFIHPEDKNRIRLYRKVTTEPTLPENLPMFRLLSFRGEPLWVSGEGSLISFHGKPALLGTFMNLTPLKEKELSLQRTLERFQTIINEVEDAVAEVDLKGTITFTNEGGCRIWGHTMEEAIGANYRAYMPDEETAEKVYKAYNHVFITGQPGKNIVYEIIRKNDGLRRTVEDYVTLIRTPEGKISGFRVVSRDITDRKKIENELAEYRSRLESLFSSAKDAIVLVDPEQKVQEVNRPIEQLCGVPIKDITGKIFGKVSFSCNRFCAEALKKSHRDPNLPHGFPHRMRPCPAPPPDRQCDRFSVDRSGRSPLRCHDGHQGPYPFAQLKTGAAREVPFPSPYRPQRPHAGPLSPP